MPPSVATPARPASAWRILRTTRTNALQMWPREAYERDVFVQSDFGRKRFLLNGEDGIHRVLVGNPKNYRRTPASIRILRPITGAGLLLSEGEAWRRQRQTVAPALAPRVIPMLARHVVTATERALAGMGGEAVNALAQMQVLTLEIASRSMFSVEMDAHGETLRRMINAFGERLGRPSLLDFVLPPSIPNPRDLLRLAFRRRWLRFMDRIMAARSALGASEAPRDLFDLLLAARDPETGSGFSHAQLRDQMATLILAGHETTALTLFWSLYLLANAPDVQARVAAEVRSLDLSAEAARPGLKSLSFTRTVIQESMRLYPPAFTLARQAIGDDAFGDVTVPAGSIVLIAPWVLHRHTRLWADSEVFDPARFEGEPPLAHRFAYLPFGAGPRVCVGAQFAMTEAMLVLAMVVQRFEVTQADAQPVRPVAVITTQPDRPAPFRFRARA